VLNQLSYFTELNHSRISHLLRDPNDQLIIRRQNARNQDDANGLQVHIHANVNEIDNLPAQLARVRHAANIPNTSAGTESRSNTPSQNASTTINGPPGPTFNANQQPQRRSIDFGSLFSNIGPMVNNLFSSMTQLPAQQQQNQPANQSSANTNAANNQSTGNTSSTAPPTQIISTLLNSINAASSSATSPERRADPSVSSVISNISSTLGIDEQSSSSSSEQASPWEALLLVAMDHIGITDMMAIASGNWSCLERIRIPVRRHMEQHILNGDTSPSNRQRLVETYISKLKEFLTSNEQFQSLATSTSPLPVQQLCEIAHSYFTVLIDLICDDYVTNDPFGILQGVSTNSSTYFSSALNQMITLFIGEFVTLLRSQGIEDIPAIINVLSNQLLLSSQNAVPEQLRQFHTTMGNGMIVQFVMSRFRMYEERFAGRSLSRVPTSTTLAPSSSSDALLESAINASISNTSASSASRETSPIHLSNSNISRENNEASWTRGLAAEEISQINDTISDDIMEMNSTNDNSVSLSHIYEYGSQKGKGKTRQKETEESAGCTGRNGQEEIKDELD
jgi:hypothetical protein